MKARSIMFHDIKYHEITKMSFLFHLFCVEKILTCTKDQFCNSKIFLSNTSCLIEYFNTYNKFLYQNFLKIIPTSINKSADLAVQNISYCFDK